MKLTCLPCLSSKQTNTGANIEDEDERSVPSLPHIQDDDSERAHSNSMLRQLSSIITPSIIDTRSDSAAINISAFQKTKQTDNNNNVPVISRVKSMAHHKTEASTGLQWTESRKLLEAAIAIEQTQHPMSNSLSMYRQDIMMQESRLAERLYRLGLHMEVQDGDGNCQFRSLSWALFGTPSHYSRIRKTAIEYMQRNRKYFESFLGEEFRGYVKMMSHDQIWGDELTLRAVCEAYGVCINVVTSEPDNWFLRYIPEHRIVEKEVFLCYISPVHYNAIRRRPRGAAPMLRSLSSLGRKDSRILKALDVYEKNRTVPETPNQILYE